MTCTHQNIKTVNSRPHAKVQRVRRCVCLDCGHRWTTAEVVINESRDPKTSVEEKLIYQLLGLNKQQASALIKFIDAMNK